MVPCRSAVMTAGVLGLISVLAIPGGLGAQDEIPRVLPFASLHVGGAVEVPADPQGGPSRLSFDARFRLHPDSDGIRPGDDFLIQTLITYPAPTGQAVISQLLGAFIQLDLRIAVAGECFGRAGSRLVFRLTEKNREACVDAVVELTSAGNTEASPLTVVPLTGLLRAMSVQLAPQGRRGRWRMKSEAAFAGPGFPYPVVGFGRLPGGGPSGTAIVIGDDGGMAPFRGVAFDGGS